MAGKPLDKSLYAKTEDIINMVAIKYKVESEVVESVIDHMFSEIKRSMGSDEMPDILIYNWGRLKLHPGLIQHKIVKFYDAIGDGLNVPRFNLLIDNCLRKFKEDGGEPSARLLEIRDIFKAKIIELDKLKELDKLSNEVSNEVSNSNEVDNEQGDKEI